MQAWVAQHEKKFYICLWITKTTRKCGIIEKDSVWTLEDQIDKKILSLHNLKSWLNHIQI
jgi:hypothetical protein